MPSRSGMHGKSGSGHDEGISRRALFSGGMGAAVLLAAPASFSHGRRAAGHRPADRRPWGLPGPHGATLSLDSFGTGTTWATAAATWQDYTGCPVRVTKLYKPPGEFPTRISRQLATLIAGGVTALLCFKPAFRPVSGSDLAALEIALRMYSQAGLRATVTLWQEPQACVDGPSASEYIAMVRYYGPMVRRYYPLAYDASGSAEPGHWRAYYPGDDAVDKVAVDYYADHYVGGRRLDAIADLADHAWPPKPLGIWEMGNRAAPGRDPSRSQVTSYFGYVGEFMSRRLADGKSNGELCWYNGNNNWNTIRSQHDYRVPLWQGLVYSTGWWAAARPPRSQSGRSGIEAVPAAPSRTPST